MSEKEFKKYVELILSMSTDYLVGILDNKTYISNLEMIIKGMKNEQH